jgi:hypothetical protein
VEPTSAAFQAAAANADWNSVPGYGVILSNQPGAASWPMTAATWAVRSEEQKAGTIAALEAAADRRKGGVALNALLASDPDAALWIAISSARTKAIAKATRKNKRIEARASN